MSLLRCFQYIGGAFLSNLHWLCLTHYTGKLCIEVTPASKIAFISEELCIGCGICVKVCSGSGHFSTCRYLRIFLSMLRDQGLQPHHIFVTGVEMPVWGHSNHQFTKGPGQRHYSSLWTKHIQVAQVRRDLDSFAKYEFSFIIFCILPPRTWSPSSSISYDCDNMTVIILVCPVSLLHLMSCQIFS